MLNKCKKYLNRFFYTVILLFLFIVFNYFVDIGFLADFVVMAIFIIGFWSMYKYSICVMNSYSNGKKDAMKFYRRL